jgi:succinate dehydrogenase / fumarate reductase cytochrome b subunit
MNNFQKFYQSIVGRKIIAAITGLILVGFLLVHALGNLNSFAGSHSDGTPAINAYAEYLLTLGTPLVPESMLVWLFRFVLLVAFVLHVRMVVALLHVNRAARPVDYENLQPRHTSFAAKWVVITGVTLLLFVILHVSHFTLGMFTPYHHIPGDIYHNLYSAFQHGWLVLFYLLALTALGLHLGHGIWSLCQTMGWDSPERNKALRLLSIVTSTGLMLVFISIPLAFYFNFLPPSQ